MVSICSPAGQYSHLPLYPHQRVKMPPQEEQECCLNSDYLEPICSPATYAAESYRMPGASSSQVSAFYVMIPVPLQADTFASEIRIRISPAENLARTNSPWECGGLSSIITRNQGLEGLLEEC